MKVPVKGGVWKNTEDEILKAAVMKYGKNQWSRISSLLVRKSAKQCKARWYEWLDPSIKKTEWSREEEEKLLHLAKLMPTQWRTIAPIVGRTAQQCLEHYEKLLDAAQGKDELYDPADDPRRLRPGEIDPNPESKPARPDPVDMDEDEKEMLSEARARLANTKGKKAKRKAREKQLEEARRLASLQKRRELKAAGIGVGRPRHKRSRGIDYYSEIPFEKRPPPGFFAVPDSEKHLKPAQFKRSTLQSLLGERRDEAYRQKKRQDIAKHKVQARKNLPEHIKRINQLNAASKNLTRDKLMLPEPQLSENELEQIAKVGQGSEGPTDIPPTPARKKAKLSLSSLPAPQNEYKIVLPSLPEDAAAQGEEVTLDARELEAKQQEAERLRLEAEYQKRSSALKKDLPRPRMINTTILAANPADELLDKEICALLTQDAIAFPVKNGKIPKSAPTQFESFNEDELEEAKMILEEEISAIRDLTPTCDEREYVETWTHALNELVLIPAEKKYAKLKDTPNDKLVQAEEAVFQTLQKQFNRESKKMTKLEQRVKVYLAGYEQRNAAIAKELESLLAQLQQAEIELQCFKNLRQSERAGAYARLTALAKMVDEQSQKETALQNRYSSLLEKKEEILAKVE